MDKIKKDALINASLTTLYVIAVAIFMNWAESIKLGGVRSFIGPVAFLLLFLLSASVTSYLIFGKPVQLYLDRKKKEAVSLLTYTLITLFTFTVAFILLLTLVGRNY